MIRALALTLVLAASQDGGLEKEIESLKPAQPAWREIPWKTCLLDGLRASRQEKKPVILWVFIDRPVDDARC